MTRLVLLGEGHGEVSALPILIAKLLREKNASDSLLLDKDVIRTHSPSGLVKLNKAKNEPDFAEWVRRVTYASRKARSGAVLAVYDGDAKTFPAGATSPF